MAGFEKEDFKFPDETSQESKGKPEVAEQEGAFEVEIEDDTPPEDRGREPMPAEVVKKLEVEVDELDKYSEEAKQQMLKMKKVWHDERRAKETAYREQQEAVALAQRLMEENRKIKALLDTGGKEYAATLQNAANLELEIAKRTYKEAYDAGDTDRVIEAQNAMQQANLKLMQAQNFKVPSLQEENFEVQTQQEPVQQPVPRSVNPKLVAWQERNKWYGADEEMTAAALGLHEKLKNSGEVVIGSDEYYATLDKTIRRRFPEYFAQTEDEETEVSKAKAEPVRTKPSTVVAPAVRSTASNKVKLRTSQVQLAKKLGLTPEQYALELRKLEAQNG